MPTLSSINLRFWLPFLMLLSALVIEGFALSLAYREINHEILEEETDKARLYTQQLRSIASGLSSGLSLDAVADLYANYFADVHVRNLMLIDETGRVLVVNHFAFEDKPIRQVLPQGLSMAEIDKALMGESAVITDEEHERIITYSPVRLGTEAGQLRKARLGALILEYDYSRERNIVLGTVLSKTWLEMALMIVAMLLLFVLIHYYAVRPLRSLMLAAQQLAEGELDARIQVSGRGEIAVLANGFNDMARKVEQAWNTVHERERFLHTTLKSIGDAVIVTDPRGRVVQLNPVAEQLTGWTGNEAQSKELSEVFPIFNALTHEVAKDPVRRVIEEGVVVGLANHTVLRSRDGKEYQIADSAAPIRLSHDAPLLGVILVFRDVTKDYALQEHLRINHDRIESIMRTLPDLGFILDEDGRYIEIFGGDPNLLYDQKGSLVGQRIQDILPEETVDLVMRTIHDAIETGEAQRVEFNLEVIAGRRCFEGNVAPMETTTPEGRRCVVWLSRDITANIHNQQRIHQLAYYDELTGLLNRVSFYDHLDEELARSNRHGIHGALLYFDLDHFKDVNDSLGHDVGDVVLKEVASRCKGVLRAEDVLARLAGDEFVILLTDQGDKHEVVISETRIVAEKILQTLRVPFTYGNHYITFSASLGITIFPQEKPITIQDLMKQADAAMYRAKAEGRSCIRYFTPDDQDEADRRFALTHALPLAMKAGELQLYLQPIVDQDGYCVSAEALMRWEHPQFGWVPPIEFIPVAEASGFILKLGAWTLEKAGEIINRIHREVGKNSLQRLAINLSPVQFQQPDFADMVEDILRRHKLSGDVLTLELTEDILVSQPELVRSAILHLKNAGVSFSIDDFGTGYSSLQYLTQLPVDALKIDRSFVRDIQEDAQDAAIVDAVIQMAESLRLNVIAEGVETEEQRDFLRERNCTLYQGYYFSRPIPVDDFITYLKSNSRQ